MPFYEPLTLTSSILGPPSALIGIADKLSGWIDEKRYQDDMGIIHKELIRQFWNVQERAKERLQSYIDEMLSPEKERYQNTLTEIRRDSATYDYIHRPYDEYLYIGNFNRLLREVEYLQNRYKNNKIAMELENTYTAYFIEEMTHYDFLVKWYNSAVNTSLLEKFGAIQQSLLFCE